MSGGREQALAGLNKLEWFAAQAPEIPSWWPDPELPDYPYLKQLDMPYDERWTTGEPLTEAERRVCNELRNFDEQDELTATEWKEKHLNGEPIFTNEDRAVFLAVAFTREEEKVQNRAALLLYREEKLQALLAHEASWRFAWAKAMVEQSECE